MRVFLAGASGAIGRPLLERLLGAGHEVTALARTPQRAAELAARGATPAVADALDAQALRAAVLAARPEVVINELTALPASLNMRRYARELEPTNRLRREAGPVLARAAADAGAQRVIAQSIAFSLDPSGPPVLDETAPLWRDPPAPVRGALDAQRTLEEATLTTSGVDGVVLRYGLFYGPGTMYGPGSPVLDELRRRRFPVLGDGDARASFIHVDDAAAATVRALDAGTPGVYHVTDDEPARMADWVPALAAAIGAPAPRRVPVWLGRLLAGPMAGAMAAMRGASNAKARGELGWAPSFPSYREGFAALFG
ncbi:MAG TPA: NAD(P)-dependent oxidoreductase [Solirubrobacteraceae bacterium]|nr:NAD(P)-dependent oxidoreductase [Solirubrobacteraceae bacterium]